MKLRKKWVMGGIAVVVAGMLLINPRLTNPPVEPGHDIMAATNPPPAEIAGLLRGACYDCHSHETQWPWYSHVAPVSWWLVAHVNDGRKRLNFSNWPHNESKKARRWYGRIGDSVSAKEMPLPGYDIMHPPAKLTDAQRDQLVKWAEEEAERVEPAGDAKEKE